MVGNTATGERVRLSLQGWGRLGAVNACCEGQEVRVFGGIPGEEVVVEIKKHRGGYSTGRVVDVLVPSPHRSEPPCPYYGACTGCQWQHIDYKHQLDVKRQMVVDALAQVSGFEGSCVLATLASPDKYGYRNHARFTIRQGGVLGFVNRDSHRFVPIQNCLLMHPSINQALEKLQGRCGETTQLSIRYGTNTGDFLIQPTLKSEDISLPTGQKHYLESLAGVEFRVASSSFFQVNTPQAEVMTELVKDGLQLSGVGLLVDAYAGVGTFAILLASHVEEVIAIEESVSAVKDAEINAEGLSNIRFLLGKTEAVLEQIEKRPDGLILDPPRAGCAEMALEAVIKLAPRRVVYVSCEPETLARDLELLCQGPYTLEQVQPVDMFPQTHHVECIATLSYNLDKPRPGPSRSVTGAPAEARIVLASTSPRRYDLLSNLDVSFDVAAPAVFEEMHANETPQEMVQRLALSKARSGAVNLAAGLVIGADSVVVLEARALGKPSDSSEAWEMLRALRGKVHEVITGLAVINVESGQSYVTTHSTYLTMRDYSDEEIRAYVDSGEPLDKAGAYAVQDPGFSPAFRVDGCYTNVMGLPLCTLLEVLESPGFAVTHGPGIRVPEGCSECPIKEQYRAL